MIAAFVVIVLLSSPARARASTADSPAATEAAAGRALTTRAIERTNELQLDEAEQLAQQARGIALTCDDRVGLARALDALGIVERSRGRAEQAFDFTDEALAIAEQLNDADTLARVLNDRGRIDFDLRANYSEARHSFTRALDLGDRVHDRVIVARLLNNLANVSRAENDFAGAIAQYERSGRIARKAGDRYGVLTAEHNIGLIYAQQNNPELALLHLQKALVLEKKMHSTASVARTLLSISEARRALQQNDRAMIDLHDARAAAIAAHDELTVATILLREGDLELERGDLHGAEDHFDTSLELFEKLGDSGSIPLALTYRARLRLAQHRVAEAIAVSEEAAARADALDQASTYAEAETLAGDGYRAAHDDAAAERAFLAAIDTIERERTRVVGGEDSRQRYFERETYPYAAMVEISAGRGDARAALAFAERAKARVLLDVLRDGRRDPTPAMTGDERTHARALDLQIATLNRQLAHDPSDAATRAALQTARDDYATFRASLYVTHPELHVPGSGMPPLDVAALQAIVPTSTDAIVEYAVTDSRLFAFVVTRTDVRIVLIRIARDRLATLTARFARQIAQRNLAFRKTARELYGLLLEPLAIAGKQRVCIVPDQELWRVPFATLLDAHDRYTIERTTLFLAPSISVLREISGDAARSPEREGQPSLFAVADPPGARMPDADREVEALRKLYGASNSVVLTGAAASEASVKTSAPHFRVLHFATHGLFDDANPLSSHLVFAPSADEDGMLEARELMAIHLDADLVVLSACETAAGRPAAGEGIIGMSWAVFVAGCPTTVASEWNVESASTAQLMIDFHRGIVAHQATAEALRAAQLALMRNSRYEHPFYWASFVVIGEGW